MVLVQLKKNEELLFLYETKTTVATEDLIAQLLDLVNNRLKLLRLASACDDLVEHGPLKPENEWGLSEEQIQSLSLQDGKEKVPETIKEVVTSDGREWLLNPDPTGRRTGQAPTEDMADMLRRAVSEARAVLSKDVASANNGLTMTMLTEAENRIRDTVALVWPIGLPECESVREILDGREDLSGTAHAAEVMPADSCLWWAGKEIVRGKTLKDFIGRNEKTKITAKLTKNGNGAPARENPMNEEAQKQMMAYYYKKQEEHKKLAENDEDEYLNSPWANPKTLKGNFNGIGNISFRPT